VLTDVDKKPFDLLVAIIKTPNRLNKSI